MLRSLIALAMIAAFMTLALRTHLAAALLYWWFGIFKPQDWMWWDLSALRLPLLAAILFVGQSLLKGRLPRLDHPISMMMVLLVALALLAEVPGGCVSRLAKLSPGYLAILVLMVLLTDRALVDRRAVFCLTLTITLSFGYFTAKAGISSLLNGTSYYGRRIEGGAYSDSNAMALSAVMMILFALFTLQCIRRGRDGSFDGIPEWARSSPWRTGLTAVLATTIGASVYFVIATESRGSALSMGLAIVLWLALRAKPARALLLGGALAGLFVLVAPIPDDYRDRIASAFVEKEDLDGSAASRHHFWDVATEMVAANPLGVGVGCYAANYSSFDGTQGLYGNFRSVHSSHYSILAEIGYGGLLTWIALFAITLGTLWRTRARCKPLVDADPAAWFGFYLSNAMIVMTIIFVFGGSFYELAYNDFTWIGFVLAMAASRLGRPDSASSGTATPSSRSKSGKAVTHHDGRARVAPL